MIPQVTTRTVSDPDEAGRRIDNLLISLLKGVPRDQSIKVADVVHDRKRNFVYMPNKK